MSKISITPSATGTGVFTIASPATSTDRTLTLPDEAGTVLTSVSSLASANLTGTVTVSGSNVGIGTSSPTQNLDVTATGASTAIILAQNTTATSGGAALRAGNPQNTLIMGTDSNGGGLTGTANASYFYTTSTSPIVFLPNATERMRIDSSGRVGIGTSSPSTQNLHILSSAGVGAISQPYATLNIENSTGDPMMIMSGISGGIIASMNNSQAATPLRFYTGQTERMRIDSSGNLLVNRASGLGSAKFVVEQDTTTANPMVVSNPRSTAATDYSVLFYRNGSIVGSVQTSLSATSYVTSSDYRLKEDWQLMSGASERVLALKPVNFAWKLDGSRVDGFLAHEAQAVVPECVTGTKDAMRDEEYEVTAAVYEDIIIAAVLDEEGNELEAERTEQRLVSEAVMGTRSVPDYQGIDQSKLVPLLTAALQEALTEISALKVRVAALEAV